MIKNFLVWLISRLPFYSLFFLFPVLAMINCEGWDEGSMTSNQCAIESDFLIAYADFYYALILLSSFTMLIPLLSYIAVVILLSEFLGGKLAGK